eukprot:GHVR01163255.1.p1 GENE.GHVR01163255.1~~GHVR01163255.1.p1  ORF type:complete len:305 (+),score=55.52 GHVR01163255.1:48-917(+)
MPRYIIAAIALLNGTSARSVVDFSSVIPAAFESDEFIRMKLYTSNTGELKIPDMSMFMTSNEVDKPSKDTKDGEPKNKIENKKDETKDEKTDVDLYNLAGLTTVVSIGTPPQRLLMNVNIWGPETWVHSEPLHPRKIPDDMGMLDTTNLDHIRFNPSLSSSYVYGGYNDLSYGGWFSLPHSSYSSRDTFSFMDIKLDDLDFSAYEQSLKRQPFDGMLGFGGPESITSEMFKRGMIKSQGDTHVYIWLYIYVCIHYVYIHTYVYTSSIYPMREKDIKRVCMCVCVCVYSI